MGHAFCLDAANRLAYALDAEDYKIYVVNLATNAVVCIHDLSSVHSTAPLHKRIGFKDGVLWVWNKNHAFSLSPSSGSLLLTLSKAEAPEVPVGFRGEHRTPIDVIIEKQKLTLGPVPIDTSTVANSSVTAHLGLDSAIFPGTQTPVWMAFDWVALKIYVLDSTNKGIYVYDVSTAPVVTLITTFDISSITVGLPLIEVDPFTNIVLLTDGQQTIFAINGSTGGVTPYNEASNLSSPSATITNFSVREGSQSIITVSDSGGQFSTFYVTDGTPYIFGVQAGVYASKMNSEGTYGSGLVYGFTPNGIFIWDDGGYFLTPFTIETDPVPYSLVVDDEETAIFVAVQDVNGSGGFQVSIWSGDPFTSTESYTLPWPGTGFSGYIVNYNRLSGPPNYGISEFILGLDTTGVLYQMPQPESDTTPWVYPNWAPTFLKKFPEVCLQILPGSFLEGQQWVVYALGQSGTIYVYDFGSYGVRGTGNITLNSPFANSNVNGLLTYDGALTLPLTGTSSLAASLNDLIHASVTASSSLSASLNLNVAPTIEIVSDSTCHATGLLTDVFLTANPTGSAGVTARMIQNYALRINPTGTSVFVANSPPRPSGARIIISPVKEEERIPVPPMFPAHNEIKKR